MEPNQNVKGKFDLKTDAEKLEILNRYIDKYKEGDREILINIALEYNVAGQLVSNPNYRF